MLGTLSQSITGLITSAAEASPALKKQLDELGADFSKIKKDVLGALGNALAPAIHALGLAVEDKRFQAFVKLLAEDLAKGVTWLAGIFTNKLLPAFMDLLPRIKPLTSIVEGFLYGLDEGNDILDTIVFSLTDLAVALGADYKVVYKFSDAWRTFRQIISQVFAWITGTGIPAVQKAIQDMATWWKKHSGEIIGAAKALWSALQPILKALWEELSKAWKEIQPQLAQAVKAIYNDVVPTVLAIAKWIAEHSKDIEQVVRSTIAIVRDVIKIAIDYVQTVIRVGMAVIRGDWSGAWNAIKEHFIGFWTNIKDLLANFLQGILALVGTNTQAFVDTWRNNWNMLVTILSTLWTNLTTSVSNFFSGIGSGISGWFSSVSSAWSNVWNSLTGLVSDVWDGITDTVSGAIEGLGTFFDSLKTAAENPWSGLVTIVSGVWSGIRGAVVGGINWIIGALNSLIDAYNTVITVLGGTPLPHLPLLDAGGGQSQFAQSMSGANRMGAQAAATGMSAPIMININISGPFGPGYTPAMAGAEAGNAFVRTARAQGVRI
jgi:hypothetical protein